MSPYRTSAATVQPKRSWWDRSRCAMGWHAWTRCDWWAKFSRDEIVECSRCVARANIDDLSLGDVLRLPLQDFRFRRQSGDDRTKCETCRWEVLHEELGVKPRKSIRCLASDAAAAFVEYVWKGNLRGGP